MQENVSCLSHGAWLLKSILSHFWVALGDYFVDTSIRWNRVNVRFAGCTQKFSVASKLLLWYCFVSSVTHFLSSNCEKL